MSNLPQITFNEYETLVFSPHCDGEYAMGLLKRVCPMLHHEISVCRPEFDMTQDTQPTTEVMAYLSMYWPTDLEEEWVNG